MRRLVLVLGAAAVAACASSGVRTESAVQLDAGTTTVAEPPTTTEAPDPSTTDEPTTTEPADDPTTTEPTEPTGPTDDDETIGDSLFSELGTDDLDVRSYDVRLRYDHPTTTISGTVGVTAAALNATDRLVLDAEGLDVSAVTLDDAPAEFERRGAELVVTAPAPVTAEQTVRLDVTYSVEATTTQSPVGLDVGWFSTADGSFTLNEPDGARTWLPSNDHPSDKATWRFEITVAPGTTAVANGELVEQRPDADGDTWVWEQREPMTTYLVQVLTGDYEILDAGVVGTVPIVNAVLEQDVDRMAPYFDLTDDQLAFFEPLFGPYPLDRYGLAITDSFGGLAMEHQGRSLFSRDDFPGGEPGSTEHLLLAHELAHQWFGNAVSPADWSDLWLNESFATYGEWLWLDHVGLVALDAQADVNLEFRQDFVEPTAEPSVENLFGFERYGGGAVVVHALRLEVGDEVFYPLLQRWVADNDGTSRTTEDFTALASEVAGRDLTGFFDAWLYAADVPDAYPG